MDFTASALQRRQQRLCGDLSSTQTPLNLYSERLHLAGHPAPFPQPAGQDSCLERPIWRVRLAASCYQQRQRGHPNHPLTSNVDLAFNPPPPPEATKNRNSITSPPPGKTPMLNRALKLNKLTQKNKHVHAYVCSPHALVERQSAHACE